MKKLCVYIIAAALPLAAQQNAAAPAAQPEPGITRQQADEILQELRQIRQLLEKQQAAKPAEPEPKKATLNLTGVPMIGSKDAPLTMVEFTDFQCPFCQRFAITTFPELKKNYIDTGKVRFYSRDLPLDFHANAMRAAEAARCAADQGQFWQLRSIMGHNPDKLDLDHLVGFAKDLKMDTTAFRSCVESGKYKQAVQSDVMEAMKIGADGTPTFVIGKSTPNGVDGELVVGAMPYGVFENKFKSFEK
jgi:protein-disulfide isomerase